MLAALEDLVRRRRLYPSVILHGVDHDGRVETAVELCCALLCEDPQDRSPSCACRHCSRIAAPSPSGDDSFHPDAHFLARDLRTVTSADATRKLLRAAQMSPFEARGQTFVVLSAETLSDEAANVLLKILEEPPTSAPRHFFLLCPSADQLLPTLRSRSLSVYLGASGGPEPEVVQRMGEAFGRQIEAYASTGSGAYLLGAAETLLDEGRPDPRDSLPWSVAAAAVLEAYRANAGDRALGEKLLALAEDLLQAVDMRSRGIQARRILEGLVARHLASPM
ncbi:MAG: hypothetical protein VYE73_03530 [Acidobacteriota bacterium]|nr:hypothetical protein [Acidobacteriota bacterium]